MIRLDLVLSKRNEDQRAQNEGRNNDKNNNFFSCPHKGLGLDQKPMVRHPWLGYFTLIKTNSKGICAAIVMTQIASDLQILPKKGPLYA